jgi:hypothetical protein
MGRVKPVSISPHGECLSRITVWAVMRKAAVTSCVHLPDQRRPTIEDRQDLI